MTEQNAKGKNGPAIAPGRRADILDNALRHLPAGATAQERQRAIEAVRAAMRDNPDASEPQLVEAAKLAVACVDEVVCRRLRREHWRTHAAYLLPYGAKDEDKRKAAKLALERLEELPIEMGDSEVEEEIRDALRPLCEEIKTGQQIERLNEYGRARVNAVLSDFYHQGLLTYDDWVDSDLRHDLEQAVVDGLEENLDGSETEQEVKELVEEILADELDLEAVDDDEEDGE